MVWTEEKPEVVLTGSHWILKRVQRKKSGLTIHAVQSLVV